MVVHNTTVIYIDNTLQKEEPGVHLLYRRISIRFTRMLSTEPHGEGIAAEEFTQGGCLAR